MPIFSSSPHSACPQALIKTRTSAQLRHSRLGHPSSRTTNFAIRDFNFLITDTILLPCAAYAHAKAHGLLHPPSPSRFTCPFQLLLLDIWGLVPVLSSTSSHFYLSILNDFSKFMWLLPTQSKSNVSSLFLAFLRFVSNTLSTNVISVQSNWCGKFCLLHRLTCLYFYQQIGVLNTAINTSLKLDFLFCYMYQYLINI